MNVYLCHDDVDWIAGEPPAPNRRGKSEVSVPALCALASTRPGRWMRLDQCPHASVIGHRVRALEGYEAVARGGDLYVRYGGTTAVEVPA